MLQLNLFDLKRLREHFNDDLPMRVGQRLELTPQGQALVVPVQEVMLQIALALETQPDFDPASAKRTFRIAMSDYATVVFLPLVLERLVTSAPGLVCDIRPIDERAFIGLNTGELDLCVRPRLRPPEEELYEGVRTFPLYRDDFVCVVDAAAHAGLERMTLEAYLTLPHAAVRLDGDLSTFVDAAWARNAVLPKVAATTTKFADLVYMIAGTPMVATMRRRLATRLSRALPIHLLECPIPIGTLVQEVMWHARSDADPANRCMREVLRTAASAMEAAPSS